MARALQRLVARRIAVTTNVRNRLVNFRIVDVFHPDANQLLRELHGEDLLQGVVTGVSRGTSAEGNYAVVEVDGLRTPVIVALNRITEVV